jgi:uncharacterized alpha-E superfamily protein
MQAVRAGNVTVVNAFGSGAVEARAMLSFAPALAPHLLGEDLKIPNLATWWLGDETKRHDVLRRLDNVVIASAFSGSLLAHSHVNSVHGGELIPGSRERLAEAIGRRGVDFVAQEAVTLSTMPVWREGKLEPRPYILRLMLARVGDSWQVMPGGLVRVADSIDARAVNLQLGGRTADAWILSDKPVLEVTLLPTPGRVPINRTVGALPSRAAANLFWLGRYVERTEATLRLVRAVVNRSAASDPHALDVNNRICSLLAAWDAVPQDILSVTPRLAALSALQQRDLNGSVPYLAGAALSAASVIRERFSPDGWRALSDLVELINAPLDPGVTESAETERVNTGLRIIAAFSGLAQENMNQIAGWRFLEIGRRIERALATSRFIRQFAFEEVPAGGLDVLLELADSQITYRLRYVMVAARAPVVDLVALDPNNPRSIVFQLAHIATHLAALPGHDTEGRLSPPEQIATSLTAKLRTADAVDVNNEMLVETESALMKLSDAIAAHYFTTHTRSDVPWDSLG